MTSSVVDFDAAVFNLVTHVVPKRPAGKIPKSVLLTFNQDQEGTLDIGATDTENEITGWVPCEPIGDGFSIAVDAKTLKQCVHQLRHAREPTRMNQGKTMVKASLYYDPVYNSVFGWN